jgi:hypothetical protein
MVVEKVDPSPGTIHDRNTIESRQDLRARRASTIDRHQEWKGHGKSARIEAKAIHGIHSSHGLHRPPMEVGDLQTKRLPDRRHCHRSWYQGGINKGQSRFRKNPRVNRSAVQGLLVLHFTNHHRCLRAATVDNRIPFYRIPIAQHPTTCPAKASNPPHCMYASMKVTRGRSDIKSLARLSSLYRLVECTPDRLSTEFSVERDEELVKRYSPRRAVIASVSITAFLYSFLVFAVLITPNVPPMAILVVAIVERSSIPGCRGRA